MDTRMKFKFLIILFLVLISFSFVNAKTVCGDVSTNESITPAWYQVIIFEGENVDSQTTCTVSPDSFKYCCSVDDILDEWDPGWLMGAKIIDEDGGYVANPVYMRLTELPYDIFPTLELVKVINIHNPNTKVNVSSSNLTLFNMSFLKGYLDVKMDKEDITLDHGSFIQSREIPFGPNNFKVSVFRDSTVFTEDIDYFLLEEVNFSRTLECDKCDKKKIKKNQEVNITININFSSEVDNLLIYEYIPYEWEILTYGEGELVYGEGDYNILSWSVEENSLNKTYSVKVPDYEKEGYLFFNYLEDFKINEEEYELYNYIPYVPPKKNKNRGGGGGGSGRYVPTIFSKVDEVHPLVAENKSLKLALYSKNYTREGAIDVYEFNYSEKIKDRNLKFIEGYNVKTNLGNNLDRISFEWKLNKSYLDEKEYKEVVVYGRDSKGKMVSLTGKVVGDGENLKYVLDSGEFFREIVLFGVKSHLTWWDKVVEWYWNAFGFRTGVI